MQVVLIVDVDGLGKRGEVHQVKDGYALNYLLPKRQAFLAQDSPGRQFMHQLQRQRNDQQRSTRERQQKLSALDGRVITICKKANKEGHLFGSVTVVEMAKMLNVDKKMIILSTPIKTIGQHQITLGSDSLMAKVTVAVKSL